MNNSTDKKAYIVIGIVSAVVLLFLTWLIYFQESVAVGSHWSAYLPAVNATLNSITTILLVIGYWFIKNKNQKAHVVSMLSATATSGMFLISYITYHHFQGDTKFIAQGLIRPIYFFILISHIILSAIMVPMIFATLWHGLRSNLAKHKRIARWTFPIWIYVSITGVMIFFFLRVFNY